MQKAKRANKINLYARLKDFWLANKQYIRITLWIATGIWTLIFFRYSFVNIFTDIIASIPGIFWMLFFLTIAIVTRFKEFYIITLIVFIITTFSFKTTLINTVDKDTYMPLTICSYNTRYFFENKQEQAFQALKDQHCDVIMLQELWRSDVAYADDIKNYLDKYFTDDVAYYFKGEFLTIVNKGTILTHAFPTPDPSLTLPLDELHGYEGYLYTKVKFDDTCIDLLNIHIWNPLAKRHAFSFESEAWHTTKNLNTFLMPFEVRKGQVQDLRRFLNEYGNSQAILGDKLIFMAGDFNTLPTHYIINSNYFWRDSKLKMYRLTTLGFMPTFATSLPLIQIDHAFATQNIKVDNIQTIDLGYSDHKMLKIHAYIPKVSNCGDYRDIKH